MNDLSADEQALYDKGAIVEMYEPNEPSRRYIDPMGITSVGHKTKHGFKVEKNLPPEPILIFVFGKEDASAARSEGRSMAEFHYNRAMANQFLFAEAGTNTTIVFSPAPTCRKEWTPLKRH